MLQRVLTKRKTTALVNRANAIISANQLNPAHLFAGNHASESDLHEKGLKELIKSKERCNQQDLKGIWTVIFTLTTGVISRKGILGYQDGNKLFLGRPLPRPLPSVIGVFSLPINGDPWRLRPPALGVLGVPERGRPSPTLPRARPRPNAIPGVRCWTGGSRRVEFPSPSSDRKLSISERRRANAAATSTGRTSLSLDSGILETALILQQKRPSSEAWLCETTGELTDGVRALPKKNRRNLSKEVKWIVIFRQDGFLKKSRVPDYLVKAERSFLMASEKGSCTFGWTWEEEEEEGKEESAASEREGGRKRSIFFKSNFWAALVTQPWHGIESPILPKTEYNVRWSARCWLVSPNSLYKLSFNPLTVWREIYFPARLKANQYLYEFLHAAGSRCITQWVDILVKHLIPFILLFLLLFLFHSFAVLVTEKENRVLPVNKERVLYVTSISRNSTDMISWANEIKLFLGFFFF